MNDGTFDGANDGTAAKGAAVSILGDLRHPFFRPPWRRRAIVAVCVGWGAFEIAVGAVFWGVLFAGIGLLAAREFRRAWDGERLVEPPPDDPGSRGAPPTHGA